MQAVGEVELVKIVVESFSVVSHRLQLATPIVAFHLDFSQGEQDVPVRVKPGLQVHVPASVSMKVVWQAHLCWDLLKSVYWGQGVHPAEPSKLQPDLQTEQVLAPPTEKVPAAQFSTLSREEEGFFPADAVLQTLALSTSEYFPSLLHSVQAVDSPPMDAVPLRQSPHWVSVSVVQSAALYFPDSHVAQVEQPAAPSALLSSAPQREHVSAPPTEKVPAAQFSTLSREEVGFFPADTVLHAANPVSSEYSPSPLQPSHVF
jgi:hypothetical protein